MSIITLLTDFGMDDEYVGLMKGVILSVNPSVTIVDITHQIDAQDIVEAAFAVHSAYRYFPQGTVHLIVVDPGVGTDRDLLALEMKKQVFIAPDNGVLSLLIKEGPLESLVRISNPEYFLPSVSRTFHGRDIIAPVGAHIAGGLNLSKLGPEIDVRETVCLDNLHARILENGEIVGRIITIDHFGNLISNIDTEMLAGLYQEGEEKKLRIEIGPHVISGLSATYENVASEALLALVGSRGYLEIAVNKGNAGKILNARKGDRVSVISR